MRELLRSCATVLPWHSGGMGEPRRWRAAINALVPSRVRPLVRGTETLGQDYLLLRGSRQVVEWRMRRQARNPLTFNDRLMYKMVYDRRPLLTELADKVRVRDVIAATIGVDYLSHALVIADAPEEIDWRGLPPEYVTKVNHGSGGVVIVTEDADRKALLPPTGSRVDWARFRVRPGHAHADRIADLCRFWLTLDYSWSRGRPTVQWCYQDIPRRILVEELLRDVQGHHPREYRLFVIGGLVAFAQVEIDMFGDHRTAVMSPTWERLGVRFMDPPPEDTPEKPTRWTEMVQIAETLGRLVIDFVRVDMYDLGDRIVVGELTHYPSGGTAPISPHAFARAWGQGWPTPYGPRCSTPQ